MEGTNSFEKGLHRSNSPQMQPEGSYVDAVNWVRNDSGRLLNEELENLTASFTDGRILLGNCPINDEFICFFKIGNFSEIGVFKNGTYIANFNDATKNYKLNFNKTIDCVARINNANRTIVYFVEEDKKPRRYILGTALTLDDERDFDLQLEYKLAQTKQVITTGGSLKSGVYSIVIRYRTSADNFTFCNIPSRFVSITDDTVYDDSFDGCPPGTPTNKGINIELTRTDLNFPFVEPIIITYEGVTNVLTCRSLGIYTNATNLVIPFVSELQYKDSVPLEQITVSPVLYSSATCIEQKDNILVLSNLKSKQYDRNIQQIANNINVIQVPEVLDDIARRDNLGYISLNNDSNAYRKTETVTDNYNNTGLHKTKGIFEDPTAPTENKFIQKKSFKKGEVYSLSITPIYSDGSIGFAYHIPAKENTPTDNIPNRTLVYTSLEVYPTYLNDTLTGDIRHHKISDSYSRNTKVFLKLTNIDFSSVTGVQGYIIGYQQRNNELNTSHITTGIAKPYIHNGNYKRASLLTGSFFLGYSAQGTMIYDWNDSFSSVGAGGIMFYSPDCERGLELDTSYQVKLNGYLKNIIQNTQGNQTDSVGVIYSDHTDANSPSLSFVFEDVGTTSLKTFHSGGGSITNTKNIVATVSVPRIKSSPAVTIDSNYDIFETSGYTHIRTNASIWNFATNYIGNGTLSGRAKIRYNYNDGDAFIGLSNQLLIAEEVKHHMAYIDIIKNNEIQYGRLESAEYAPLEVVYDNLNTPHEVIIEGDVFTQKYWFHIHDGVRNNFGNPGTAPNDNNPNGFFRGILLAGIWLESKSNYNLRHSDVGGIPYYPKTKLLHNNEGTGVVDLIRGNSAVSTGYNKQYSAQNNTRLTFPKPLLFEEVTDYTNRSVYSEQVFESELVDQWRVFSANSFHDIPKNRGIITDTFVFNNNFYHHTEYGLWLSFFNPNTTQATSQGEIVLGNAGIFRIPSKLILDIKGGYMGTMDKSGTNTPFGRVFLDHQQGKIFLFAGEGPVEISDLGLFSYFREFVNTNDKYSMGYDWANKRLLLSNASKEVAISFYPKTQTWTSFHTFSPNKYLTINGSSYAWKNDSFYNLDNLNGIRKNAHITLVENTQPDAFKRFDRMEINSMSGGNQGVNSPGFVEPDSYIFNDKSFTHIHCWTDRQNSTNLDLAYSNDYNQNFLNGYDVTKVPVNYYRSSFHLELPLDAVVDPNINIFENSNLDLKADFRPHMKGKFLYTKLSYNHDKPLVLNYIKTYFKPSVA
jgi:hypothetical protein